MGNLIQGLRRFRHNLLWEGKEHANAERPGDLFVSRNPSSITLHGDLAELSDLDQVCLDLFAK